VNVWGSKAGGARNFCSPKRPDSLSCLRTLLLNGFRVLSGVKRDNDHSTPSSAGVNEWNYKITPVKCLRDVDRDNLTFTHTHTHTHKRRC
jgi:hypothetical protein